MKFSHNLLLLVVCMAGMIACKTPQQLSYLQAGRDTTKPAGAAVVSFPEPRIQKGDLLTIRVSSASLLPEVDALYNLPPASQTGGITGYLVDQRGEIKFPRLGSLNIDGMTKLQVADLITAKIKDSLLNPVVDIRFMNFKINVLGEVARPGQYSLPTENVNVLEALAIAGDATIYAQKQNVRVLRNNNGIKEEGIIDLTQKDVFNSPYFQLKQNDILIVYENAKKRKDADVITSRNIGIATGVISTLALIINVLRK
jgi:polysaccharide biosynthesis/export protein